MTIQINIHPKIFHAVVIQIFPYSPSNNDPSEIILQSENDGLKQNSKCDLQRANNHY